MVVTNNHTTCGSIVLDGQSGWMGFVFKNSGHNIVGGIACGQLLVESVILYCPAA